MNSANVTGEHKRKLLKCFPTRFFKTQSQQKYTPLILCQGRFFTVGTTDEATLQQSSYNAKCEALKHIKILTTFGQHSQTILTNSTRTTFHWRILAQKRVFCGVLSEAANGKSSNTRRHSRANSPESWSMRIYTTGLRRPEKLRIT